MVELVLTEDLDHAAHVIRAVDIQTNEVRGGARTFRYEEMWTRHETYEEMVHDGWMDIATEGTGLGATCTKLSKLSNHMQQWGHTIFGSVRR